jgi:DeoR family transcriptional regulator of aga operon
MAGQRASGSGPATRTDDDDPGHRTRRQRLDAVLDLVIDQGYVSVEELTARLHVSPATVRRDLDVLASQQLLIRSHGGASAHASASALPLRYRASHQAAAKDAIARTAVGLVPPGGVIGLNGGTTTTTLAHELAASQALAVSERPTVLVTNALNIAQELAVRQHLQLVVTGGVVRGGSFELVGTWAEQMLEQIHIDLLFLGADAVSVGGGARTHDEAEAAMSARLADRAGRVVVVADSTKLGQDAFARIRPIDAVHTLITDDGADPDQLTQLREAGIEVLLANKEPDT